MIESKYAYHWVAEYANGEQHNQEELKSVEFLDKEQVKAFHLVPMCSSVPPVTVKLDLEDGERFISYWLVDYNINTGTKLYRHVVGIQQKDGFKTLMVVSPNGKITLCTDDNQSYAGE